jgi:hypothetical protein
MILAFLLGGALATLLIEVGNRDATIFLFGLAMLVVWIREWNQHLACERDRATANQRLKGWIADGVLRRVPWYRAVWRAEWTVAA